MGTENQSLLPCLLRADSRIASRHHVERSVRVQPYYQQRHTYCTVNTGGGVIARDSVQRRKHLRLVVQLRQPVLCHVTRYSYVSASGWGLRPERHQHGSAVSAKNPCRLGCSARVPESQDTACEQDALLPSPWSAIISYASVTLLDRVFIVKCKNNVHRPNGPDLEMR